MTTKEAASSLGITTSTIRNQLEKGVLHGSKNARGEWVIALYEVDRYRKETLGHHSWTPSAEREVNRVAALRRPDTRAKMRAAKLGRRQSPEHVANRALTAVGKPLPPEWREKIRRAQAGKTLAPDHLDALRASHRKRRGVPLSAAHRASVAVALVRAHEEGRRPYTPLENRAAEVLLPLGYRRNVLLDGHAFDFGSSDDLFLVEVNGCHWHDHRAIKPECPTRMRRSSNSRDEERRDIARAHGRILIELWECEERTWPDAIALFT